MGGTGSGLVSPARMRRTRATFSSPKRYISGLPSAWMPAARKDSTSTGSPSSITTSRSTAVGKGADALQRQRIGQPDGQMAGLGCGLAGMHGGDAGGDDAEPGIAASSRIGPSVSFQAAISASFWRSR